MSDYKNPIQFLRENLFYVRNFGFAGHQTSVRSIDPKTLHDYLDEAEAMHLDAIELAIIKQCVEQSTSEASKYAEGYKEGYNRALELIEWYIKNITNSKNNEQ